MRQQRGGPLQRYQGGCLLACLQSGRAHISLALDTCAASQTDHTSRRVSCRYGLLAKRHPEVPEYRLHWAQSLCRAGGFGEAARAAAAVDGFAQVASRAAVPCQHVRKRVSMCTC